MVFHATRAFRASLLALVLLQFLALQQNALAQVAGGTISRTVTDADGSVIPNAEITITNVETGIGRNAITNEVGIYITPNLLPERYDVKFSAAGFKTSKDKHCFKRRRGGSRRFSHAGRRIHRNGGGDNRSARDTAFDS